MAQIPRSAKIIPFPTRRGARSVDWLVPIHQDVPVVAWMPALFDSLESPEEEPVVWLERALVEAKIFEIAFLRALGRLPPTALSPELMAGELEDFIQTGHRLTLALELLRLGQIGPVETMALLPGLRRAWSLLRTLREAVLVGIESDARSVVQSSEAHSVVGALDVDRALAERSRGRTLPRDPFRCAMSVPGGHILPMPDDREIALRRRRERRLAQDSRPMNLEADLAGWLEELPGEWLEGMARSLQLPLIDDRWERERAVRERICMLGGVERIVVKLLPLERRILHEISKTDGWLRYDGLLLNHGADDETAWHWAEEAPTSPLERVRRCGLVFVGRTQVGRRGLRVAVIPPELRTRVSLALDERCLERHFPGVGSGWG